MQKKFIEQLTNGVTEDEWKAHKAVLEKIEVNVEAMV